MPVAREGSTGDRQADQTDNTEWLAGTTTCGSLCVPQRWLGRCRGGDANVRYTLVFQNCEYLKREVWKPWLPAEEIVASRGEATSPERSSPSPASVLISSVLTAPLFPKQTPTLFVIIGVCFLKNRYCLRHMTRVWDSNRFLLVVDPIPPPPTA